MIVSIETSPLAGALTCVYPADAVAVSDRLRLKINNVASIFSWDEAADDILLPDIHGQ